MHAITLDHRLFSALDAPPGLHGFELLAAVTLAQWVVLLGPALLVGLWLAGGTEDRAAVVAAAAAAVLALVLAAIISPIVDSPRPFLTPGVVNYLDHSRDGSFPSDHATLAFALAVGLWRRRPPMLPQVWIFLLGIAIAVGWARVFLGAHYPFDIAGGALVGTVAVFVANSSAGRVLLRPLQSLAETVRSHLVATWRWARPSHSPGR